MKIKILFIIALLGSILTGYTQNKAGTNHPNLETWTEAQIVQWEDSVKNALYPVLETETTVASNIQKQEKDTIAVMTTAASNIYVPNSVTVDQTKAVGEIPMSSAISPSGAVTCNVPLEVYPGSRSIQPQLSIVYNHQAGNGILGVGWNISGLSSINRAGLNMYYDGKSQGIKQTKDDAFYLDGMRLIKLSETTTQANYESEQGNIKAKAVLNGTAVRYFEVFYPNGTKGTYGYTSNSGTNYLEYPQTSFSDLHDNSITYAYTCINNHYRITEITYGNASVVFNYTSRQDSIISYNAGLKIKEDQLLQKITCKFGSTVLRNYEFSYTVQKNASLLSAIDYSIPDNLSFNPLKFYYGENNTAYAYNKKETQLLEWYVWTDPGQLKVCKGKFDYGTDDDGLISLPNSNPYWEHYRHSTAIRHSQNRFDNYYEGTEKIFLFAGLNSDFATPMPSLTTEANFIDIFCANLDGKWEEEVIKVNNGVSGSNDQVTFKVYAPNLYNGLGYKYTRIFNFPTVLTDADGGKSIHPKYYFTGDFNGNGKMEVLAVSCHNPFGWTSEPSKCYLFDLEANTKLYEGQPFAYNIEFVGTSQGDADAAFQNTDRLFVFDYDGDGKTDICLINSQGTYIYTFTVSGSSYSMTQVSSYSGLKKSDLAGKELMIGEFNGDGKPDFLLSPTTGASNWFIYYSMGNGGFEKTPLSITSRGSLSKYVLQDVNSDGLTDVIVYNTTGFYTYLAKNGNLSPDSYRSFDHSTSVIVPTNINSRNYFHQLVALKNGKVTRFSYPRNDTKEKLLTGSVSSFGVVSKNYYRMLNENFEASDFYTKGSGAVYPYENFQGPLYALESKEQYFGGQKNENISYRYENAVIHKQGLGFRGFEKITSSDNVRGRTQTQKYDPFNFSVLKEEETPVTKNTYTYSVSLASNKIAKVRMTNLSSLDKLKNTTLTSSYTYDTYGSPLTETVNYGSEISESISNTYFNNPNESAYLIGFPTNRTKTTTRNGSSCTERDYISAYNSAKGLVNQRKHYINNNQTEEISFSYNTQGLVTQEAVKTYSAPTSLTTTYTYDTYGRLTGETNPLGHTTSYQYWWDSGLLLNITNHFGKTRILGYDPFGRNNLTYDFDETQKTTAYTWNQSGTNGLYCITSAATEKPTTKVYYDALNRETCNSATLFNGTESHTNTEYDTYGRLKRVSLPFTVSSPSYWNTYNYDSYDRPTSITEASGKTTAFSYSGNSATTVKDGISSTKTYDTQGKLIQVVDPAGTITYNLRPDGNPSSIVAPGNVTTSFAYDSYGRQTSITDPSAGTQTYTYDAVGNISTETDANNKTISYNYDTYNRLIKKIRPEFVTDYKYKTNGLLESKRSNNATATHYTYDDYGRLVMETDSVPDNKWLQKIYYYLSGHIISTSYVTQDGPLVTENYTFDLGYLTEVKMNGATSIWKQNSVNAFGQATNVTTGSFNRSYGYNVFGLPTSRTAGTFQNFTYSFDAVKGNLTYRKDNLRSSQIQENFYYDNLNRLTGYGGLSAGYDVKGNLLSKEDAGTGNLQYNIPDKPYAISGVTSASSAIPLRNQSVTYTSFKRPASISENGYVATFTYNDEGERVKMEMKKDGVKQFDRYYISDCYEIDEPATGGFLQKLYLFGDYYSAPAVFAKEYTNGAWNIYYLCRD